MLSANESSTGQQSVQPHLFYMCHHQNQFSLDPTQAGSCRMNTARSGISGLNQQNSLKWIVDSKGRHVLDATPNNFNMDNQHPTANNKSLDPPSYIYASMTQSSSSQASSNSRLLKIQSQQQQMQQQNPMYNLELDDYDTLNNEGSLGYDDPINLIPERDKGFILTRDFIPIETTQKQQSQTSVLVVTPQKSQDSNQMNNGTRSNQTREQETTENVN